MDYSTQCGRSMLHSRHAPPDIATTKWNLVLPPDFQFRWGDVWDTKQAQKEAGLLWQLWHRAIAVNVWRGKISHMIVTTCPMCLQGAEETIFHRFWNCPCSQHVWSYTTVLLNLLERPTDQTQWSIPDWKQALFAEEPSRCFKTIARLWLLLRGTTLWTIWIARNHFVFN
jgi:hypothetical protein